MLTPIRDIYSGTIQLPYMHIAKAEFHSRFYLYLDNHLIDGRKIGKGTYDLDRQCLRNRVYIRRLVGSQP